MIQWMYLICDCASRQGYKFKFIFVPLHKDNSSKNECNDKGDKFV